VPPAPGSTDWLIVIRSAVPTRDGSRLVVVDLPVEAEVAAAIEARTKERIGQVTVVTNCGGPESAQPLAGNRQRDVHLFPADGLRFSIAGIGRPARTAR
jgi:hypothetical protein